jgi:hypothetical protein
VQRHGLRLETEAQHVGNGRDVPGEWQVRHGPEVDGDLLAVGPQCLAGPQAEDRPWPAPIVELEQHLSERLGVALWVDALLVDAGGQARTGAVAGPAGAVDGVVRAQRPH